ncbi:MAG: hypothetical protein RIS88_2431, partial [Pseudomonadota bacterium]
MPSSAISRAADPHPTRARPAPDPHPIAVLQKVVRSTIIDAPIERVWAVLR